MPLVRSSRSLRGGSPQRTSSRKGMIKEKEKEEEVAETRGIFTKGLPGLHRNDFAQRGHAGRLATKLAHCHRAGRPRILLQRAHARNVLDGARTPGCSGARTCLTGTTAIDWSDHGLTAANKSRRCTAAYSHHLTPTTAVVNVPAATNVPAAAHPHHSCDGVDGRPTAQLSFIAQQQATARAAASALRSGLLRVRGRVEGGVQ